MQDFKKSLKSLKKVNSRFLLWTNKTNKCRITINKVTIRTYNNLNSSFNNL